MATVTLCNAQKVNKRAKSEQRSFAPLLFLFFKLLLKFGSDFEFGLGLMLRLELGFEFGLGLELGLELG